MRMTWYFWSTAGKKWKQGTRNGKSNEKERLHDSKTKTFCTRDTILNQAKLDPCSVCRRRVRNNSIRCNECEKWVRRRNTGIRGSLAQVANFKCKPCQGRGQPQREEFDKSRWRHFGNVSKVLLLKIWLHDSLWLHGAEDKS